MPSMKLYSLDKKSSDPCVPFCHVPCAFPPTPSGRTHLARWHLVVKFGRQPQRGERITVSTVDRFGWLEIMQVVFAAPKNMFSCKWVWNGVKK